MAMGEFENGEFAEDAGDDSDDIARFERQCAARARAEGLPVRDDEDEDALSDDNKVAKVAQHRRPLASPQNGGGGDGEYRRRCAQLQEKLARREMELAQVKGDLELMGKEGPSGDAVTELKQRLLDVSKKHRALKVNSESQKARISQLEGEMRKPKEELRKQAEEIAAQTYGAMLGDGTEDWKKKYLQASNQLQQARQEAHELRTETQRQKKVLIKELGPDESLERAMAAADDPAGAGWKGRAAQMAQLQKQVRELKEQLKSRVEPSEADSEAMLTPQKAPPKRIAGVAEKDRAAVDKAAEKRREEFDRLQEEVERLRGEQAEAKRKREGLKSRNGLLEGQLKEMKVHMTTCVQKSENDDELVAALRRQLGRHGTSMQPEENSEDAEGLRQENEELQAQLERQAQIVLQLKQKNLQDTCEAGSVRMGPRSVDAETPASAFVERVRYLEAENAKQIEHVRLLQRQLGEDEAEGPGRPFSAGSSMNVKERLRQMGDRLATSERENATLRQLAEEQRPSSSASGRSSSAGPRGALGPDMEQLLRQNEALKREVAGLRRGGGSTRDRVSSPCSSLGGDR